MTKLFLLLIIPCFLQAQAWVRTPDGPRRLAGAVISGDSVTMPSAQGVSAQTLADTASAIRGDFPSPGGGSITTLKKTSDQTINSGAGVFTDVTGLTFPVVSGTDYAFRFYVVFRSAATATGWKASVNCPAGTLDFFATGQTIANAAAGAATWLDRHNVTRDDMTLLTATITQNVDLVFIVEGRYMCTANGTFAVRFANELASNTQIVVQKGSWGIYF